MDNLGLILGLIGFCIGAWGFGFSGALNGGLLGFLLGSVMELKSKVKILEQELIASRKSVDHEGLAFATESELSKDIEIEKKPDSESDFMSEPLDVQDAQALAFKDYGTPYGTGFDASPDKAADLKYSSDSHRFKDTNLSKKDFESSITGKIITYLRDFFTTGNVVVKVGVIVLFFGIAFLVKYAADRSILPIELRLCGISVIGIGLLVFGWKKRESMKVFGLSLQGGGIGILYLTVFSAVKIYNLIPPFLALFLMVSFVFLSGFIAVVQDARSLAVLASAGGFLAPVLVSSGGGSHVSLFSYYLILNAGVLGVAWFKAWRELNLTGFAFTFVISAIWGLNNYKPEFFESTEPFLLAFFIMYVLVSVLFAIRQAPNLKGYVDGALVFGLPLTAFGLQSGLVRHFEYGIAISSLALALFYVVMAVWVWKKKLDQLRMLAEAYLAIGVVFATLAIPFAFDRQWIAASWGLEGASMVWIGLRQRRCLARSFGLILQVCAGYSLLTWNHYHFGFGYGEELFILNTRFFNAVIMSFSGLISGYFYGYYSDRLYKWEKFFSSLSGLWGTLWWFGGGLIEIERHIGYMNRASARLVFMALSGAVFVTARKKLDWRYLAFPPLIMVPWMFFQLLAFALKGGAHPFEGYGIAGWLLSLISHFYVMNCIGQDWKNKLAYAWHVWGFSIVIMVISWEAAWLADHLVKGSEVWRYIGWIGVPGLIVFLLVKFGAYFEWPENEFRNAYLSAGPSFAAFVIIITFMLASMLDGDPAPLSYFPLFNPADLMQLFGIVVFLIWSQAIAVERMPAPWLFFFRRKGLLVISSIFCFILMNLVVARSVHSWAGVNYSFHSLNSSFVFHASISILWTLSAFLLMITASRKSLRKLWFAGVWLLGVVVVKLFFVDLGGRGTGERIISFLAVGALMLVIGYFSPLPPSDAGTKMESS